jgi:hypothetical protein
LCYLAGEDPEGVALRIGLLGGTGIEGKGLALRFAAAGAQILLGSRSAERAEEVARKYNDILGLTRIRGMTNSEMVAGSEIVFLTLPFGEAPAAVRTCAADLHPGLVLVDVTVPMEFRKGQAHYLEQEGGSNSEIIARNLPEGVELVAAFKAIPAHFLAEVQKPLDCDVFLCGNSTSAKDKVMGAVRMIPALRPLDAGPLAHARILERMTVLAVYLNRRYKSRAARYRVIGI